LYFLPLPQGQGSFLPTFLPEADLLLVDFSTGALMIKLPETAPTFLGMVAEVLGSFSGLAIALKDPFCELTLGAPFNWILLFSGCTCWGTAQL